MGIERAHVVGASMGGMIVQSMAIAQPERVLSLTSIMSNTGDLTLGQADPAFLGELMAVQPMSPETAVESGIALQRLISGPLFDEVQARDHTQRAFDRSFRPAGVAFQTAAIFSSPHRTQALGTRTISILVLRGRVDSCPSVAARRLRPPSPAPASLCSTRWRMISPRRCGPRPSTPSPRSQESLPRRRPGAHLLQDQPSGNGLVEQNRPNRPRSASKAFLITRISGDRSADAVFTPLHPSSRAAIRSISPHRNAVSASIVRPDRPRYALRWWPMRRVTLTVPPAPGISP